MNQSLPEHLSAITENFYSKTKQGNAPDDCWQWLAAKDKDGYGHITYRRKNFLAHRISFLIHNGYMPTNQVLHSCDNPQCCNPLHLRQGTNADNMSDNVSRGRQAKNQIVGEKHGSAKLIESQVLSIRELLTAKVLHSEIARQFNVSPALISHIKCRRKWNHI